MKRPMMERVHGGAESWRYDMSGCSQREEEEEEADKIEREMVWKGGRQHGDEHAEGRGAGVKTGKRRWYGTADQAL